MVAIADKVASKLEEKKGSITEDEVTKHFQIVSCFYILKSPQTRSDFDK